MHILIMIYPKKKILSFEYLTDTSHYILTFLNNIKTFVRTN